MGKYSIDAMLNAALDHLSGASTHIVVCTTDVYDGGGVDPDFTKVSSTSALIAPHAVSGVNFTNDDGLTGRKVTVAAQPDLLITGTGTQDAAHICLISATEVLYMTTCTTQSLSNGSNVSIPAWDIELRDPT